MNISTLLNKPIVENSFLSDSVINALSARKGKELYQSIIDLAAVDDGFVAVKDIIPTNPSNNVGNKQLSNGDYVLDSCVSSTSEVTVHVVAITGKTKFKPTVTVNTIPVTNLIRNALTDVWEGSVAITLDNTGLVTVLHDEGASATALVSIESAPVVQSIEFSNAYSQGVGQTQTAHAAGQKINLTVTSDVPFVQVEVIDSGALTGSITTVASTTTTTLTNRVIANRGNTTQALPAYVRVKNATGTWSDIVLSNASISTDEVTVVNLNNTRPSVTFGSIVYPMFVDPIRQLALKVTEEATVNVTYSNADTALWSSTEVIVSDPTVLGNKTVNRNDGVGSVGYNISTDNLQVVLTRTANATTATFSTVVWIADDNPVITKTLPDARLRSGVDAQNHVITLDSDQRLISIAMGAGTITGDAAGTFSGAWATANNGLKNTRTLVVADSDPKGTATFTGLSAINLAGKEVTTVDTDLDYVLGGFLPRTVTMAAFPGGERRVAINTSVLDATKVTVINLSKGSISMTYDNTLADAVDRFTIVNSVGTLSPTGDYMYNRDLDNAQSNLSGNAQFIIEETVL